MKIGIAEHIDGINEQTRVCKEAYKVNILVLQEKIIKSSLITDYSYIIGPKLGDLQKNFENCVFGL
jgi:hypothetical protein